LSAEFVSGGTAIAAFVIALFLFRYWRDTLDLLFLMFAGGFFTLGISRVILAFLDEDDEGRLLVYGLRLIAFTLILAAIVYKNRTMFTDPEAPERSG
jgi:hypothetical protein